MLVVCLCLFVVSACVAFICLIDWFCCYLLYACGFDRFGVDCLILIIW